MSLPSSLLLAVITTSLVIPTAAGFQELEESAPRTVILLDQLHTGISGVETRWIDPSSHGTLQFWVPRNATAALLAVTLQPGIERTWNLSDVSSSYIPGDRLDNVSIEVADLGDLGDHPVIGVTVSWSVNQSSVALRLDQGDAPLQVYLRPMGTSRPVVEGAEFPLLVKGGSERGYTYRTTLLDDQDRSETEILVAMPPVPLGEGSSWPTGMIPVGMLLAGGVIGWLARASRASRTERQGGSRFP